MAADWMDTGVYRPVSNLPYDLGPADEPCEAREPGGGATSAQCLSCGRRPGNGCRVLACRGTAAERAEWAGLAELLYAHPDSWMAKTGRVGHTWPVGMYRDHGGVIVQAGAVAS